MKKISIKLKIILWFSGFMLVLLAVMYGFFFFIGKNLVKSDNQGKLTHVVDEYAIDVASTDSNAVNSDLKAKEKEVKKKNAKMDEQKEKEVLENDRGKSTLEVVSDEKENNEHKVFYNGYEGVYVIVYDEARNIKKGTLPTGFDDEKISFDDQEIQTKQVDNNKWYIYDRKIEENDGGCLWVRGVSLSTHSDNAVKIIYLVVAAGLPILFLFAGFGSYIMLKRAFLPVNAIMKAAEEIGEGKDLKKRIHLGEGNDEIYKLANTFDHMFERLEDFFENEKRFTSDASHELRTPVSAIIAQCEYALENAQNLDEAKESLEKILDQSQKMSILISELLLLARADKGTQKLNIEWVNVSDLAEIIAEQQSELAEEKSILIHSKIEKGIVIQADETMLVRIFINLIENAIAYGKKNGNVFLTVTEEKDKIKITVEDDGIGIKESDIERIWERFYQVDASRNAANGNSGLGLSMVKWMINAHDGTVTVESTFEKGSKFTVFLPKTQQQ